MAGHPSNRHFEHGRLDTTETAYCLNSKIALIEGVIRVAHHDPRNPADRLRACREGLEALLEVWRPTFTAGKWDKRPTWDNWNKTGGGKPWDNQPTWDNWNKKKK